MKWKAVPVGEGNVIVCGHVWPVNDDGSEIGDGHRIQADGMCWCEPRFNPKDETIIYKHNSPH